MADTKKTPESMTYSAAYEKMEIIVTQLRDLSGRDLDQVLPLLRQFHAARKVVL